MTTIPSCCLILLNYNGQHLLKDSVPSALRAANALGRPCPVVVVDNCSTENDVGYLQKNFSEVEVMVAKSNDFLFSLNDIVAMRSEDIVIILNNDMKFDEGFIPPLLQHFGDPDVFAVTGKLIYEGTDIVITARSQLVYRNFWYSIKRTFNDIESRHTLYAAGGAAAYRRTMFLALGGFDRLFHPFYYEEIDISYRAWRRGWKVIYEPGSVMHHKRSATLEKMYDRESLNETILRNQILFNIKDCGGWGFLVMYLVLLIPKLVRNILVGNNTFASSLWDGLPRFPMAIRKRFQAKAAFKLSDSEIMAQIDKPIEISWVRSKK